MQTSQSASIIKNLCKIKNLSISTMLADCNIRKSLIYDMEKRDCIPSSDVLEKIADYLDCSVDYLLGRTKNPKLNPDNVLSEIDMHSVVNIDMQQVFNPTNAFTRYAFHIMEAYNEIIINHKLLNHLMDNLVYPDNIILSIPVLKSCIVSLCESAKIVFLQESKSLTETYQEARDNLIQRDNLINEYDQFKEVWNDCKDFFRHLRNYISHFDHEKTSLLQKYVSQSGARSFVNYKSVFCDFNEPIFLEIMKKEYENIPHAKKEKLLEKMRIKDQANKDSDSIVCCINLIALLLEKVCKLLEKMQISFFMCYTANQEINNNESTIVPDKTMPFIKYKNATSGRTTKTAANTGTRKDTEILSVIEENIVKDLDEQ